MTSIAELLAAGRTVSFEFFPPRTDAEQARLVRTLRELEPLQPSFVSVTQRGGPSARQRTFDLVTGMLRTTTLLPMAHLTCVGQTRLELAEALVAYRRAGVENLMALGGDPLEQPGAPEGELRHALELVELARAIGGFTIGVAAHPLGHPRSPDLASDRRFLAAKLQLADFAVTQFFFCADDYRRLVADLGDLGVAKPVLPGIMPVTSLRSVPRMAQMGAAVPGAQVARLEAAHARGGDEAVRVEGLALARSLCEELLDLGVPGLHFYTLNQSRATRELATALGLARVA
jgi:methylenetetrahydrofolate reductase (NADPH)